MDPVNTSRLTLARRLREIMDNNLNLNTQVKMGQASGLGQATLSRLLSLDQAATLDVLDALAQAVGVAPAHLLLTKEESELLVAFSLLSPAERVKLQGFLSVAVPEKTPDTPTLTFERTSPITTLSRAVARANVRAPQPQEQNESSDQAAGGKRATGGD